MTIILTENVHDPSFFNTPRSHTSHADEIYCPRHRLWVSVDEDCLDCGDEDLEGCGLSDEEEGSE